MGTLTRAAITSASLVTTPQAFDVSSETRTPKAGVYSLTSTTVTGTFVDGARYGRGMTDGTTSRCLGVQMEDNALANNADDEGRQNNAAVIDFPNVASSAQNAEATFSAFHAAGSDLNWTNFPGSAFKVVSIYMLEGDWAVVEFAGNATAGSSSSVTGLSFAPDFVQALSHFNAYTASTGFSDSRVALGYAIKTPAGTVQQVAFTDYQTDTTVPIAAGTDIRDDCIITKHTPSANGAQLQVTSFTSDGIIVKTLLVSESVSTALLIGRTGRQMWCGIPTSIDTSSASAQTVTDVGFTPEGYAIIATDMAAKNGKVTGATASKWSTGIYTGAESACTGIQFEVAIATSDTRSITDSIIAHVLDDAGGVSWKASHSAMAATGPTISIDDASTANRVFALVAWAGPTLVAPAETVGITEGQVFVTSALHSSETVGITDAQLFVTSALHSAETVGILDASLIVTTSLQSAETVAIQDASLIVTSSLQSAETVAITDASLFVTSVLRSDETVGIIDDALLVLTHLLESGETVGILDAAVLVATAQMAVIANETVGITDAALFTSSLIFDETVGILDGTLLVFSTLQLEELENILDDAVLAGTGVAAIANETVGITEAVQFVLGQILTASETVGILDTFNFGVGLIPGRAGPGRGRTVEGGAERGRTIDGGSLKGGTV